MPDSSDQSWSNGSNAPQIPYLLYTQEKEFFGAAVIAAVSYGIVVALFFQCMNGLLFPTHPATKGVQWGFVAHTVAVFSSVTIGFAIDRDAFSISYINGREFTGVIPGPIGFAVFASPLRQAIGYLAYLTFPFNQWLADGLLLYRCFVIYSRNYWAIAFPSLMYIVSIAMGIMWSYRQVRHYDSFLVSNITYLAICVSLNIFLTLMIIVRLALHSRNIRSAIGASPGPGNLYRAIITMLVESFALNAVGYILFILSISGVIFSTPLGEIQAISLFLIILRVTNRTALTSEVVTSGNLSSIHFESGERSTGETSDQFGVGSQDS